MAKVHVKDTETGHIHEVHAVDAREMVAQDDGRYAHHTGKVRKSDVVPTGTEKGRAAAPVATPQKAHRRNRKADPIPTEE